MGCHAADGSANTKAGKNTGAHDFRLPDLEKETDATLIEIVSKGKKKMPKFEEKLKGKEIKQLVEYVRGFLQEVLNWVFGLELAARRKHDESSVRAWMQRGSYVGFSRRNACR